MTIRIYDNRIEFDNYTLAITSSGLTVNRKNTNETASFTASSLDFLNDYLGDNNGYAAGGYTGSASVTAIDRMPFRDYAVNALIGNLTRSRYYTAGSSSSLAGYNTGGQDTPGVTFQDMDKFPFTTSSPSVFVGNAGVNILGMEGHSSNTHSYMSGGYTPGSYPAPTGSQTRIRKFAFANDSDASAVPGVLTQARYLGTCGAGHQSSTTGYHSGGYTNPGAIVNTIDKFPFATDSNATDVGDMTINKYLTAGISSQAYGYNVGGLTPTTGTVERFSFITNRNSVSIGNLLTSRYGCFGYQSKTSGYVAGGYTVPGAITTNVERFPFAAGPNAALAWSLTNITQARAYASGHQD